MYVHCKKKNDPPLYLPSLIFIISTSWSASRPYTVTWRWHRIFHGGKSYVQRDEVVNAGCIRRSAMIFAWQWRNCSIHHMHSSQLALIWTLQGLRPASPITIVLGKLFCFDWGRCQLDSLGVLSCRLPVLNLSTQHLFTQSRASPSQRARSLRGHLAISGDGFWLSQLSGVGGWIQEARNAVNITQCIGWPSTTRRIWSLRSVAWGWETKHLAVMRMGIWGGSQY